MIRLDESVDQWGVVSESSISGSGRYFHGSRSKFQKFEEPRGGKNYGVGIYLTQDPDEAIQYSLNSDEDGWLYTVQPKVSKVFDVHSKMDADKIRREMERRGFKFVTSKQYDFEKPELWGDEPYDHQNWYWRLLSMLGRSHLASEELNKEIFTWFDAILDSKRKWLVLKDPKKVKIVNVDKVVHGEYEFSGPIGQRKFVKKSVSESVDQWGMPLTSDSEQLLGEASGFRGSVISKPVYHGTKKKFDSFERNPGIISILGKEFQVERNAFFFTESIKEASTYGPVVLKCFLNLKKPLIDDAGNGPSNEVMAKILEPLLEFGKDGRVWLNMETGNVPIGWTQDKKPDDYYLSGRMEWVWNAYTETGLKWPVLDNKECVKRIIENGYDGTFVDELNSGTHHGQSIAVFDAKQIKIVGEVKSKEIEQAEESVTVSVEWGIPTSDSEQLLGESVSGLYHLSPNTFTEFKQAPSKGKLGVDLGFHFGTEEQALKRLDQLSQSGRVKPGSPVYLYRVKLNVSKPIHIQENRLGANTASDLIQAIMKMAEKGEVSGVTDEMLDGWYEDKLMLGDENLSDISMESQERQLDLFRAFLKAIGHDSVTYENAFEGPGLSYIVFDPAQIDIQEVEELSVGGVAEEVDRWGIPLTEGLSDILYHQTGNAAEILSSNEFQLSFAISSDAAGKPEEKWFYLSTARSPQGNFKQSETLVLDGRKLGQRYSGGPIDYWGPNFRKASQGKSHEMEDRIWSRDRVIPDAKQYILEVHVMMAKEGAYTFDSYKLHYRTIFKECKKAGIPVFFYNDSTAYRLLNKAKAVQPDITPKNPYPDDEYERAPGVISKLNADRKMKRRRSYVDNLIQLYYMTPEQFYKARLSDDPIYRTWRNIAGFDRGSGVAADISDLKKDAVMSSLAEVMRDGGFKTIEELYEFLLEKFKKVGI